MGWSTGAWAQGGGAPPKLDTGDTAFVLLSTALVMLMTPGLALFYGGMVRRKNALATIMQSFICLGLIGIAWVLYGYSQPLSGASSGSACDTWGSSPIRTMRPPSPIRLS